MLRFKHFHQGQNRWPLAESFEGTTREYTHNSTINQVAGPSTLAKQKLSSCDLEVVSLFPDTEK